MQSQLPIYPEQASNFAPQVDALMLFISGICVFFAAAVTVAIVVFFFKYRRKTADAVGITIEEDARLEALWMIVPLILSMAMFG
ncbi:MAG: cytochrome c oxidase subunit II, partial [Acidobacteria bacterium]